MIWDKGGEGLPDGGEIGFVAASTVLNEALVKLATLNGIRQSALIAILQEDPRFKRLHGLPFY